jgi:hypothetical protein
MSKWVDMYLGKNSLSKIEQSGAIKKTILTVAQKADGINLDQLSEEVFELSQDIFKSLNAISGHDIKLDRKSLQENVSQSISASALGLALKKEPDLKEMLSKPLPPEPKKRKIVSAIFEIYLQQIQPIISAPEGDDYSSYALEELQRSLIGPWLSLDPHAFYED